MPPRKRRKAARSAVTPILAVIVVALLTFGWIYLNQNYPATPADNGTTSADTGAELTGDILAVHFIDAGQSDSILVVTPDGHTALIDAGNSDKYAQISSALDSLGIKKLDWLILTHPHADHIGAASKLIDNYDIGTIYMTRQQASSSTYEKLLRSIQARNCTVKFPAPGDTLSLGDTSWTVLSPKSLDYKDVNDTSIVVRLTYKSASFLFTGDGSGPAERDMLRFAAENNIDLRSDVLKVGHHGSSTASTAAFLEAMRPKYAVICCGTGNSFGHPSAAALERLTGSGAKIYRTDLQGDIIIRTDGTNYSIVTQKQAAPDALLIPGRGVGSGGDADS